MIQTINTANKTSEYQKLEKPNCHKYLGSIYLTMFLWFNSFSRQISRSAELGTPCKKQHHKAQPFQHWTLVPIADLPGWRTLQSAGINRLLLVPHVRLSSVSSKPLGFHGRWTPCLQHSAGGYSNISVTLNLLSTPQYVAARKVIPGHHHRNLLLLLNLEVALLLRPLWSTDWLLQVE